MGSGRPKVLANKTPAKPEGEAVNLLRPHFSAGHLFQPAMAEVEPSPSAHRRVLSIQSHVVSGYVGNKSATFPLQVRIMFFSL